MRLIDADMLREEINSWGMNDYEPSDFTDAIDDAPTVEAIPKDQYEARLKADMVAMLEELYMEIEELDTPSDDSYDACVVDCEKLIQQKIDKLKEQQMTIEEIGRYDPYTDKFIKNTTTDRVEIGTNGNEYLTKDKLYTKADIVAMLTEILLEIEQCGVEDSHWIIRQKINSLKEERNERNEVC